MNFRRNRIKIYLFLIRFKSKAEKTAYTETNNKNKQANKNTLTFNNSQNLCFPKSQFLKLNLPTQVCLRKNYQIVLIKTH